MSIKLLVVFIIFSKHYPSTYCLTQGRCFILFTSKLGLQPFKKQMCKVLFTTLYTKTIITNCLQYILSKHYLLICTCRRRSKSCFSITPSLLESANRNKFIVMKFKSKSTLTIIMHNFMNDKLRRCDTHTSKLLMCRV